MALAKKNSNSTRTIIIAAVIIAVAGIGYVLYQQFFLNPGSSTATDLTTSRTKSVITNFGESILTDPRYTTLKSFDQSVNADANRDGGQINPFR